MMTVGEIAKALGGRLCGDGQAPVRQVADVTQAGPDELTFLTDPRYRAALPGCRAAAILVAAPMDQAPVPQIVCVDPYLALALAHALLQEAEPSPTGRHPTAVVDPSAAVDARVFIGPHAVVEPGARVGANTQLGAGSYVGHNAVVGPDCILHPGARLMARCRLGARVILQPGATLGADGFGFAVDTTTGRRHKLPQLGIVVVEDDVEIGANSCIDRATFGVTRIGRGSKIDDLVMVGHNVQVGDDCVLVSQSGVGGSSRLGARVQVGAQGGIAPHLGIAQDTQLAARAGVAQNIDTPGGTWGGAPAMPHRAWLRSAMLCRELPAMRQRIAQLEAQLAPQSPATHRGEDS